MNNPVGWFEIYVEDMDRAKRFYETVCNVQLSKIEMPGVEMWAFPHQREGYGVGGALVKTSHVSAGGNSVIIYFNCVDCAVEAEKSAKSGGRIEVAKMSIGQHGFIALVIDTEGNRIGLHSMQ